ncbi:metal ABC transporter substrate-binding protein [Nocardioides daphniae]|uniref:Zinc ABC transporter substrate-binding protein n=1 Tax=Nocardioides daphniae TaxID=402297 RepID=A0A4P7UBY7_9ACTN|nr:metal ABC transporter substrate-binding protein [Nocardioides daphniae]QCC77640.1 zinc ABC transporter substrate-binding protein [Nocardioides daphniae]
MRFNRRATSALAALAATALVTTGCGALAEDSGDDGDLRLAAGFYPLAWVAERVAGEHATITTLSQPGQDAHDAELTITARAAISDADLVLLNGGFQPAVDVAAEQSSGEVLDAAKVLELREVVDHEDHAHAEDDHADANDHHAEDDHADDHEGHDHGDVDPHFWLDPLLMADLGDELATSLGQVSPDLADEFTAGAEALRAELEQLDADYTEGLAGCSRRTVVVSHDAFGYLSATGLSSSRSPASPPAPSPPGRPGPAARPDPYRGRDHGLQRGARPVELAESLAKGAGVTTAVLDPIEGLGEEPGDADYLSLMRDNLAALTKANGC